MLAGRPSLSEDAASIRKSSSDERPDEVDWGRNGGDLSVLPYVVGVSSMTKASLPCRPIASCGRCLADPDVDARLDGPAAAEPSGPCDSSS